MCHRVVDTRRREDRDDVDQRQRSRFTFRRRDRRCDDRRCGVVVDAGAGFRILSDRDTSLQDHLTIVCGVVDGRGVPPGEDRVDGLVVHRYGNRDLDLGTERFPPFGEIRDDRSGATPLHGRCHHRVLVHAHVDLSWVQGNDLVAEDELCRCDDEIGLVCRHCIGRFLLRHVAHGDATDRDVPGDTIPVTDLVEHIGRREQEHEEQGKRDHDDPDAAHEFPYRRDPLA